MNFVLRIKLKEKVLQFEFTSEYDLKSAIEEFQGIYPSWFAAKTTNGTRGKIIYEYKSKYEYAYAEKTIRRGAYADHIWRTYFDNYDEAEKFANDINAKVTCWADVTASKPKLIWFNSGTVICYVDQTDPYKD